MRRGGQTAFRDWEREGHLEVRGDGERRQSFRKGVSGVGRARGQQPAQLPTPFQVLASTCPSIPRYSNLDLQTQEAYEMATRGLIRPMNKSPMLITGIRCLHFAPPEFLLGKLPQEVGAGRWGF